MRADAKPVAAAWIVGLAFVVAVLSGAVVVVAPVLLAIPFLAAVGAGALYLAIRVSRKSIGEAKESWPVYALVALWIIIISLPSIVAFDTTGFTKDQGLFNPQSIGRILIFLVVGLATLVFWAKWGRSPMRRVIEGAPLGLRPVFAFYGWYVISALLVVGGTSLALSVFRSLEWVVAVGLLALLFSVQNARGENSFRDRLKLIVPMLFFLLFSNFIALPIVPGMIYSVSVVTGTGRLGGLFTHPNLLALICVLLCAYGLAFLVGWRRNFLVLISVVTLVLTYSRGGFAAFAAMSVFALWFLIRGIPARLVLVGLSLVSALVLLQIPEVEDRVLEFMARGQKTKTLGSLSERTAVWEAGKILIERSPWLGSGFISGPKLLADVMIENRLSSNFAAPHAHNEFLQAQISGGPLALILSLFLQLRIALLLFRGEGLLAKERFFGWSVFSGCVFWGFLQPSLSYFLYLPGVLLIWLLLTLEGLRNPSSSSHGYRQRLPASTKRVVTQTALFLAALVWIPFLAPKNVLASEAFRGASFVAVQNGHLTRDGQRLRVWGVNLQSGVFKTYAEIDALISRIDSLGFNAIRLWPTSGTFYRVTLGAPPTFNASVPGDGSDLDRFDYLVAAASRKGINIQMPMLHYLDIPMLRASQEPAVVEMSSAAGNDAMLRRLHGFAPYVSVGYRERLKLHMQRVLARTNPYTGRRYADEPAVSTWELANEANFVQCSIDPECLKRLPPVALAYLDLAWKASPRNPKKIALPSKLESIVEPAFFAEYARFVAEQFISVSIEMRAFARQIGGAGSGVSVQPFIFNTDPGERSAVSHYAYSTGDVFSASAYSSPLTNENGYKGSPWRPFVAGGKPIPFLEYIKVKDKPFIVYEGSFFRPYPFRAEWGVAMAAVALKQDWDGAFLYSYGQPGVIYENNGGIVGYGGKALPDPVLGDSGERGQYVYGFHHGGDPVAMASWSVGAHLFLAAPGIQPNPDLIWDIPLAQVFKPGLGYPAAFLSTSNLINVPRVKSMAIRFTEETPICSPCLANYPASTDVITFWDTVAARVTVQTPGGKAIAGEISGDLGLLHAGISAQVTKLGFGVAAVVAGGSGQVGQLYLIGEVANTGGLFESSRVDFSSPAGAFSGVLDRGKPPLIYSGPNVRFLFPDANYQISTIDFGLTKTGIGKTGGLYDYSSSSGVFRADVIK